MGIMNGMGGFGMGYNWASYVNLVMLVGTSSGKLLTAYADWSDPK